MDEWTKSDSDRDANCSLVDARDSEYISAVEDAELRETIYRTVTTYRRPDRLNVGDAAPNLELIDLATKKPVRLSGCGKPLVLIFGSYT